MGSRILVVDDAADLRFFLRLVLEKAGYEVCEAENGLRAAERVSDFHPDLITLDVNMPFANGFAVCKILKTNHQTSHIPIIMLTARGEQVAQDQGIACGADDYTVKPVVIADFLARVEGLLSARARGEPVAQPASTSSVGSPRPGVIRLAAVAGGAGALQSARRFLPLLPGSPPFPVLLYLQIPLFAARYQVAQFAAGSRARYCLGEAGTALEAGCVYVLPHEGPVLVPVRLGAGFALGEHVPAPGDPPDPTEPPRADHLLRATAALAGTASLCVVLSGTGSDGIAGLLAATQYRGRACCEAPAVAVVNELPRKALEANSAAEALGHRELAFALAGQDV